jgi:hypothetical protein
MNQSIAVDIARVMPEVAASGLLTSLCTITVPPRAPGDIDAGGAPDPAAPYTNLSGHVDIPCTAAALSSGDSVQPTEVKTLSEILAKNMLHVLLGGYYPTIIADYRAVVDGIVYDIVGVENDSQGVQTRLALELATV